MKFDRVHGLLSAGAMAFCLLISAPARAADPPCAAPAAPAAPAAGGPVLSKPLQDYLDKIQHDAKCADSFKFDYGVPTSPGLALIGTSTAVSSPSADMKPYTFSLPASFGGSKDSQAFTGDASLIWLMRQTGTVAQTMPYNDFLQLGYFDQLAYRTRLQAALFQGDDGGGDATKAKASRLAVGLSASLLADSDPVTVKDGDGVAAWKHCVDGVFESPENKKLWASFESDGTFSDTGDIYIVLTAINRYINMKAVGAPADAQANALADATRLMDACLSDGHPCKKYDTNSGLAVSFGAADYAKVKTTLEAMHEKANQASSAFTAKTATDLGLDKMFDACLAKANALARSSAQLDIGIGAVWSGTPGKVENFTDANGAIWLSGKLPIGKFDADITSAANYGSDAVSLMLGGALRATFGQQIATGNAGTPFFKADVFDGWLGLERYSASTRFGAQIGYMQAESETAALKTFNKSGIRWLVSASFRADKLFGGLFNGYLFTEDTLDSKSMENGIWVNATYGSSSGTTATLDDKTIMISLSFSPSEPFEFFHE